MAKGLKDLEKLLNALRNDLDLAIRNLRYNQANESSTQTERLEAVSIRTIGQYSYPEILELSRRLDKLEKNNG